MRLTPDQRRQDVRTCSTRCTAANRRRKPGERYIDPKGYAIITTSDGRTTGEHRYIVELLLGRPLFRTENVHHLNGHRADNRTDGQLVLMNGKLRSGNLELWSSAQPAGQEVGPKLEWAVEMAEEYADFVPDDLLARMAAVLERRGYGVTPQLARA